MVAATSYATIPSPASAPLAMPRKALLASLQLIGKATDRRSSLPVLADLLLECYQGRQRIRALDLNCFVSYLAPGDVPFAAVHGVTVNAKLLTDMVKSATGADVILGRSGAGINVASNGADATLLGTNRFADFPKIPDLPEGMTAIDGKALAGAIDVCEHAICQDQTRFHLNGMLMEARGYTITVVATDGHRLAKTRLDGDMCTGTCILPENACKILRAILMACDAVKMEIKAPYLHVSGVTASGAVWEASFKTIDAQYPPPTRRSSRRTTRGS